MSPILRILFFACVLICPLSLRAQQPATAAQLAAAKADLDTATAADTAAQQKITALVALITKDRHATETAARELQLAKDKFDALTDQLAKAKTASDPQADTIAKDLADATKALTAAQAKKTALLDQALSHIKDLVQAKKAAVLTADAKAKAQAKYDSLQKPAPPAQP